MLRAPPLGHPLPKRTMVQWDIGAVLTHVYGRMNAPATIDAIHDLMAAKGGAADDIGKLSKGEFYFSTEGSLRPFKVRTSLCLSWHPPNPPTAEEVIKKARSKLA